MEYSDDTELRKIDNGAGPVRCDHPGCAARAEYRAPKARNRLGDYYWFCLDHIREYNRNWNYCAGMSDIQVEFEIRNDTV